MSDTFENISLPWPDWKIVNYLGGGAYGKVYEIERSISGIDEKAAVKIISRPKDANEVEDYYIDGYDKNSVIASYEEEIKNYISEYKLMKELQGQSNIVSCDDFTIVPHEDGIGGDIFIRMELLTSLQQSMKNKSLTISEIVKLGKDISRALVLCEKRNIVHRDIKPQNIMISRFGDYKLGDFGNSKVMNHATYATTTGTSGFQAPEVVQMKKYGHTADIYSLGITLYWLLNNRKMPFIEANSQPTPMAVNEALQRRYNGEKLPAPKKGSVKLKKIVLKACEYRPEDRYASAQEMYDELDTLESRTTTRAGSKQKKEASVANKISGTVNDNCEENETNGSSALKSAEKPENMFTHDVQENSFGNSWESTGTIGSPGVKTNQDNANIKSASETIGVLNRKKEKKKNTKTEKHNDKKENVDSISYQSNLSSQQRDEVLSKIDVLKERSTLSYVIGKYWFGVAFGIAFGCFASFLHALAFPGSIMLFSVISRLREKPGLSFKETFVRDKFEGWRKISEYRVPDLYNLIKTDDEFAKRLYYEKCSNRFLLDSMRNRNPRVVKEIESNK